MEPHILLHKYIWVNGRPWGRIRSNREAGRLVTRLKGTHITHVEYTEHGKQDYHRAVKYWIK